MSQVDPRAMTSPPALEEIVLSFDIEAAGPAPGLGSMVNIGLVGLTISHKPSIVYSYEANLCELPDAVDTLAKHDWWNRPEQASALAYITHKPRDPARVMKELAVELEDLKTKYGAGRIHTVAWPAAYDWQWLNYYMWRFTKSNPLGYACRDIGSYHWGATKTRPYVSMDLSELKKRTNLPAYLRETPEHSGLIDAYYQGLAFIEDLLANTK